MGSDDMCQGVTRVNLVEFGEAGKEEMFDPGQSPADHQLRLRPLLHLLHHPPGSLDGLRRSRLHGIAAFILPSFRNFFIKGRFFKIQFWKTLSPVFDLSNLNSGSLNMEMMAFWSIFGNMIIKFSKRQKWFAICYVTEPFFQKKPLKTRPK